jgi:FlaA1/EpsC-like NDP-sugar epimerase/lipopolysaccharide/colanic/teichoic acid biosynthesis glycosyltransferase
MSNPSEESLRNLKSLNGELSMYLAKRLVDILLSIIGLTILAVFLPVIGLLIKLDSRGPLFYLADRVGRGMKIFKMYKFRTMVETPVRIGESISPQYDPRVTTIGRLLRRTKINELPQFINILKGEMTFVGPRPEAPDLAELYPEEAKRIFSVKPGLVGPATIFARNEEEFYPPGADIKKYYIGQILPRKVKLDLEYIENANVFKDIQYILGGIKETMLGSLSKKLIQNNRSQLALLISDIFLMAWSYLFASSASLSILNRELTVAPGFWGLPLVILVRLICNTYFRMYSSLVRYISFHDIIGSLKGVTFGSFLLVLIDSMFGLVDYWGFIFVIDWACAIILLSSLRFSLRFYWDKSHRKNDERGRRRILIYGACDEGNAACRAFTSERYMPFEIVGFIDDSPAKYGKTINGKRVLGNRHHIKMLAQLYRVNELLIAEQESDPDKLAEIMGICKEANLKCQLFSYSEDMDPARRYAFPTRNLEISDILPVHRIQANHALAKEILSGKTVLVNGSAGALGLELCRKLLKLGCGRLIILDRYESYLNEMAASLLNGFGRESIVPMLNDSDQIDSLREIFKKYRPHLIFHAGMRKFEPFLGVDLGDIGRANYLRTFNLAKVASEFQCELFVVISSLGAAKGGSLIADSLRIAELSLEHYFGETSTRLIIARLCDIAENRGGIVSIIEEQVKNRETVLLPSPEASACIVSKNSAAEFILQALTEAIPNLTEKKLFVYNAGPPVSLIQVAKNIAGLYGMKLGEDIMVKYTDQSDALLLGSQGDRFRSSFVAPLSDVKEKKEGLNEEIVSIFKDFVRLNGSKVTLQDWKARTRDLVNLCTRMS